MSNLLPHERERIPTGEPHSEERRQQLEDLKSGKIGKMPSRTIYLHLEPHMISPESGATVQIQLGGEGIVAEAWSLDDCIATTNKTYNELGIEVKEVEYE